MEMRTDLSMRQTTHLVMTPRLQQALKLLELPTLEMVQRVEQELLINPALEVVDEEDEENVEGAAETPDEAPAPADLDGDGSGDEPPRIEEPDAPPEPATGLEAPADDGERAESNGLDELDDFLPAGSDGADDWRPEEREQIEDSYERVVSTSVSFRQHLEEQLRLATDNPDMTRIGEFLIGSLDERGYLTLGLDEIAEALGVTVEAVEPVLTLVQAFDPSGVAARDLRECLLLQLRAVGEGDSLPARIITDHLEDVLQKRFAEIARRTHISQRDVERAVDRIGELDPRPGYRFATEPPPYITPDLIVERVDDELMVALNDRHVPRLRISSHYQQVLREARQRKDGSREFLTKKLESARWLIDIIEQRRRTMLKVMRDIVEYQRDFFEHGLTHLKPMTLNQVADRIGMHESTVSRVTRGKYVQTPHGVFELKYFFSPGLKTDSGVDVSARKVKGRLRELVNAEDSHEPLSDQQLVESLRKEGFQVARRTVAKYRDTLQILPARMRRQS